MMRKKQQAVVLSQKRLTKEIFDLRLSAPEIASGAAAGQFVNVYCSDSSRLLPRPISLAGIDGDGGVIRLIYRVSGAGTEEFSRLEPGDKLELLGPLGNGFPVEDVKKKAPEQVFLIGGGIGIPPLLETAKALRNAVPVTAVLGYRDGDTFLAAEFREVCDRVLIATEDGSAGVRGTVLDAIRKEEGAGVHDAAPDTICQDGENDSVCFACGPTPMLRALQAYAAENEIECWLSLEERMACGIGACLACVCRTAEKDEHSQVNNRRVCREGPVFRAEEIIL